MPSFAFARDRRIEVEGLGTVPFDIGYGGAFYALVDVGQIGLNL